MDIVYFAEMSTSEENRGMETPHEKYETIFSHLKNVADEEIDKLHQNKLNLIKPSSFQSYNPIASKQAKEQALKYSQEKQEEQERKLKEQLLKVSKLTFKYKRFTMGFIIRHIINKDSKGLENTLYDDSINQKVVKQFMDILNKNEEIQRVMNFLNSKPTENDLKLFINKLETTSTEEEPAEKIIEEPPPSEGGKRSSRRKSKKSKKSKKPKKKSLKRRRISKK